MTHRRIFSYVSRTAILSLLMTALTVAANAGTTAADKPSHKTDADSIPLLRGVAVSADLAGIAQLALSDYGQYEAALRINIKDRWLPVAELGYGVADSEDPNTKLCYKTSSPYFRVGMDFNIAKNKHDDYRIYAGARYAFTYYKYDVWSVGLKDPVWGDDADFRAMGIKSNYHWLEAVFGVDAKIAGPFRLGWSLRYRRRVSEGDNETGNAWYVPGYGKQGSSRLGATFNVTLEL